MEWQPIEAAPKDGRQILIACPEYLALAFWNGRSWDDGDFHDNLGDFWTHWMPLPTPPDGQQPGGVVAQGGEG